MSRCIAPTWFTFTFVLACFLVSYLLGKIIQVRINVVQITAKYIGYEPALIIWFIVSVLFLILAVYVFYITAEEVYCKWKKK